MGENPAGSPHPPRVCSLVHDAVGQGWGKESGLWSLTESFQGRNISPEKLKMNFVSCADLDLKHALPEKLVTLSLRNHLWDAPRRKRKTSQRKTSPCLRRHDVVTKATEDVLRIQRENPETSYLAVLGGQSSQWVSLGSDEGAGRLEGYLFPSPFWLLEAMCFPPLQSWECSFFSHP